MDIVTGNLQKFLARHWNTIKAGTMLTDVLTRVALSGTDMLPPPTMIILTRTDELAAGAPAWTLPAYRSHHLAFSDPEASKSLHVTLLIHTGSQITLEDHSRTGNTLMIAAHEGLARTVRLALSWLNFDPEQYEVALPDAICFLHTAPKVVEINHRFPVDHFATRHPRHERRDGLVFERYRV